MARQSLDWTLAAKKETATLTCVIRRRSDPTKKAAFEDHARNRGQAIPRCGADLIGYLAPHEGSSTLAQGIYDVASLADDDVYRATLAAAPLGRQNDAFAQRERVLLSEDRKAEDATIAGMKASSLRREPSDA